MKKAFTKFTIIIVIFSLFMQTIVPASYARVDALTPEGGYAWISEGQAKAVAHYAQKFVKEGNDKKILIYSQNRYDRIKGYNFEVTSNEYGQYNGKQNNGAPFTNMLVYDSASFIATIFHRTLYMQLSANTNARDNIYTVRSFLEDARNKGYYNNFRFVGGERTYTSEQLISMADSGGLLPGDVIVYDDATHIIMYIGKNEDLMYEDFKMTEAEVETLNKNGMVTGEKITIPLPDPHYYVHASNTKDNITVSALELLPYIDEIDDVVRKDINFYVLRAVRTASNLINEESEIDMDIVWPDNTYSAYTKVGTDPVTGKDYEYYYMGTPDAGIYSMHIEKTNIFEWLIDKIGDLASWLAGFITMIFRVIIVGWANILENVVSSTVQSVGEVQRPTIKHLNSNEYEVMSSDILNIEDIVYNRVPLFDANIFNQSSVAGVPIVARKTDEEIEDLRERVNNGDQEAIKEFREYTHSVLENMAEPDITYIENQALKGDEYAWNSLKEYRKTPNLILTIRKNVAEVYNIIRGIAIVGLLVTLIYIGIRMAISSIAEQKSKYKQMLVNWCVSIIIVYVIHYVMIFILQINEELIKVIQPLNQGVSFYESFKTMAYEVNFLDGWIGAIVYLVLLVYLIKYVWIYLKRFFTLCILTMIAPVIGIGYAIDKIKDNKSQSLARWMKNYVFNVIIQFVHAALYTVLMSIVYGLLSGEHKFSAAILACIFLNFIASAPKIVENIFKIRAGTLKNTLEDVGKQMSNIVAIKGLLNIQKNLYKRPLKAIGKGATAVADTVRYGRYKKIDYSPLYDIENEEVKNEKIKEAKQKDEALRKDREEKIKADKARRKAYTDAQMKYAKNVLNMGKSFITSAASIPTMVLSPKAGIAMLVSSRNSYNKSKTEIQKLQSKTLGYDVDKFKR